MQEILYAVLGITFTALPFVVAFLLAISLVAMLIGFYNSPVFAAVSVFCLFFLETALVYLVAFKLGLTIYPQDLLFVPMAFVAGLRLLKPDVLRKIPKSLWWVTALMSVSFIEGLVRHGSTAGVEFRSDFYFLTCIFFFSSFEWSQQRFSQLFKWVFPIASLMLIIVWYRWTADTLNLNWIEPLWRYADATGVPLRVINSSQALLLGQALILLVYAMASGDAFARWRFLVPFLAVSIIVLQHRSVWVSAFLPVIMAALIVRQGQARLASRLGMIVLLSAIVLVPLLATGKFDSATSAVTDAAERATSTTGGTFVARVEGWDELLKQWTSAGPRAWLIGNSYGSGFARESGGQEVTYAPHNYLVQLLLRVGAIGLMAFLLFHWYLIKGAIRLASKPYAELTGFAMIGLIFSQILYYIPYSPNYLQGVFLGIFLSILYQYKPSAEVQATPKTKAIPKPVRA